LDKAGERFLPELFKPELSKMTLTFSNSWPELRKQFGWLNYKKMKELIEKVQEQLPLDSLFLPTYELNKRNFNVVELLPEQPEPESVEGVDYYKEFVHLWEDSYDFTIVPGSKGYSAKYKDSPRLWIFKDCLRIAPGHINPLNDALCQILSMQFSGVTGRAKLKFNSPELSLDKFKALVMEIKTICKQRDY
jgi:hypothetical protein